MASGRCALGDVMVDPVVEHERNPLLQRRLAERDLALERERVAGRVVGRGDDDPGDLAAAVPLAKGHRFGDAVLGVLPRGCLIARREQHVRADGIRPPVVADPRHTRDHHRVADAPGPQRDHRGVRFFERVAPAHRGDHVGRSPAQRRVELPVLLDHRGAKLVAAIRKVVAGAACLDHLVRAVEQVRRHARQRRAAVALRRVEDRRVGAHLVAVLFQRELDQEHARRGDRVHRARIGIHRDEVCIRHGKTGSFNGRHDVSPHNTL